MIKTIDLDRLSKEEKDKVAQQISGRDKAESGKKDVWIKTEYAVFRAVDFRFARIDEYQRMCDDEDHWHWDVVISLNNDVYIVVKKDSKSFEEAQKYMYDLFDCINEAW